MYKHHAPHLLLALRRPAAADQHGAHQVQVLARGHAQHHVIQYLVGLGVVVVVGVGVVMVEVVMREGRWWL